MKSPGRWIVVAFALVAAFALSLAVQSAGWWMAGEVAFGPFGTHHCFGGECRATDLAWLGGDDRWLRSAVATRVAGFVTVAAVTMLAGAVAAGRVPRLVARMTLVACASALVVGGYFVARCPAVDTRSFGWGLPLYAAGVACATGAAAWVLRARRLTILQA